MCLNFFYRNDRVRGRSPGRTIQHGNGRFRGIPEISWKQYSGERIRWPDLSGSARNRQEPVKTGSRIRLPDFCVELLAFSGGFRPETASFLRVFAGNSWNTASGIIVLGACLQIELEKEKPKDFFVHVWCNTNESKKMSVQRHIRSSWEMIR